MLDPSLNSGQRLPAGTVTFLFTDIEGSTRLLQQLGEKYATLLADHERILREACESYQGHVVDVQGDGFFNAFSRAQDAIQAVVQSQRALASHVWPDGVRVRVRSRPKNASSIFICSNAQQSLELMRDLRIKKENKKASRNFSSARLLYIEFPGCGCQVP
jgi:hypothetical protein